MKKAGKLVSAGLALCAAALIFGACTQPTAPSDPTT